MLLSAETQHVKRDNTADKYCRWKKEKESFHRGVPDVLSIISRGNILPNIPH